MSDFCDRPKGGTGHFFVCLDLPRRFALAGSHELQVNKIVIFFLKKELESSSYTVFEEELCLIAE